jgi:C4-dicarboxylate-specific signal transduction histidine kinase
MVDRPLQAGATNLLNNAFEALTQVPEQRTGRERSSPQRRRGGVIVIDNGPGIAADVGPHIFDYFSTKAGRETAGLPTVKRIIRSSARSLSGSARDVVPRLPQGSRSAAGRLTKGVGRSGTVPS